MLPPQVLLMCSEPPSLPATFASHTCRPAPLTSISLFFLFKAACSTRTSSPPYDFCSAFAEPLWGQWDRKMCPQQHVHGQGLQPWGCTTSAHQDTPANWGTPQTRGPVCMVALGRGLTGYPSIILLLHMSTPGQGVPAAQDSHLTQPAPVVLG